MCCHRVICKLGSLKQCSNTNSVICKVEFEASKNKKISLV